MDHASVSANDASVIAALAEGQERDNDVLDR
jgi:hypothetical protein